MSALYNKHYKLVRTDTYAGPRHQTSRCHHRSASTATKILMYLSWHRQNGSTTIFFLFMYFLAFPAWLASARGDGRSGPAYIHGDTRLGVRRRAPPYTLAEVNVGVGAAEEIGLGWKDKRRRRRQLPHINSIMDVELGLAGTGPAHKKEGVGESTHNENKHEKAEQEQDKNKYEDDDQDIVPLSHAPTIKTPGVSLRSNEYDCRLWCR